MSSRTQRKIGNENFVCKESLTILNKMAAEAEIDFVPAQIDYGASGVKDYTGSGAKEGFTLGRIADDSREGFRWAWESPRGGFTKAKKRSVKAYQKAVDRERQARVEETRTRLGKREQPDMPEYEVERPDYEERLRSGARDVPELALETEHRGRESAFFGTAVTPPIPAGGRTRTRTRTEDGRTLEPIGIDPTMRVGPRETTEILDGREYDDRYQGGREDQKSEPSVEVIERALGGRKFLVGVSGAKYRKGNNNVTVDGDGRFRWVDERTGEDKGVVNDEDARYISDMRLHIEADQTELRRIGIDTSIVKQGTLRALAEHEARLEAMREEEAREKDGAKRQRVADRIRELEEKVQQKRQKLARRIYKRQMQAYRKTKTGGRRERAELTAYAVPRPGGWDYLRLDDRVPPGAELKGRMTYAGRPVSLERYQAAGVIRGENPALRYQTGGFRASGVLAMKSQQGTAKRRNPIILNNNILRAEERARAMWGWGVPEDRRIFV